VRDLYYFEEVDCGFEVWQFLSSLSSILSLTSETISTSYYLK